MVRELLRSRGIEVGPSFAADLNRAGKVPVEVVFEAARSCAHEADFLRRVREGAG
jgi:hypothetical protein